MGKYRHIFFDLDRTLWDYDRNAREAIKIILAANSTFANVNFELFYGLFDKYNEEGWKRFLEGRIKKNDLRIMRFHESMKYFGIDNEALASKLSIEFLEICPAMPHLIDGADELLKNLFTQCKLHIITNGFSDIQYLKMRNSHILQYFDKVFTSDEVGYSKPDKRMFHHCISAVQARKKESLMIGDDYAVDIEGARKYGIEQLWLNIDRNSEVQIKPQKMSSTYIVSSLSEVAPIIL